MCFYDWKIYVEYAIDCANIIIVSVSGIKSELNRREQ